MNQTDRNLLFGILAVQMDFVARDALIAAMHAWVLERSKPLGRILVEQQALSPARQSLLEQLVNEHLAAHDGVAEKSLTAVGGVGPIRDDLQHITDPELHATLDRIIAHRDTTAPDAEVTMSYGVVSAATTGSRFCILRAHAKGGLGQLSVALDSELNREVALKELRPERADDPDSRARFLLEAEITGRLEHPGVVPVYGLGCDAQGRPFYAMRLVRGQDLKEAIEHFHQAEVSNGRDPRRWNLELRQLLNRFVAVCNVVAYAHSRGVIHRDLKPANIVLGPYGETLVVDWGLAKVVGRGEVAGGSGTAEATLLPASGSSETLPGTALGTPAYMSPEQAAGRLDQVGPLSDVYSLGGTLYCLLAGKPPVGQTDVGEALRRVQRGAFPPPRAVRLSIPQGLEAVCLKAMALKPEDRYGSARALAEDIERWLADEAVSTYRDPISTRLTRWGRRHRSFATGIAALLLTTIASLLVSNILIGYQKLETELQRRDAEAQHGLANERAKDLERELYIDRVNRAYREWEANNITLAEDLLDQCPEPLRGFEWRFVRRLCHLDERTDRNSQMVRALAISPDGRTVASGGGSYDGYNYAAARSERASGELVLRDAGTGAERFAHRGLPTHILGLAFSPRDNLLASAGVRQQAKRQGEVTLWDPASGRALDTQSDPGWAAWSVAFSPDGRLVAAGYSQDTGLSAGSGGIKIWKVSGNKLEKIFDRMDQPGAVFSMAFSSDGRRLAAAGGRRVQVFNADGSGWSPGPILAKATGDVYAVTFQPGGKLFAAAGHDAIIRLWDPDTGAVRPLPGHEGFIWALAYNRDGTRLASAAEDRTIRLWDTEIGSQEAVFRGHRDFVMSLVFHPDGRRLTSGGLDQTVKSWDLVRSQLLAFRKHDAWVMGLHFSPDGQKVVSGSGRFGVDRSVRIWDPTTGRELLCYRGHQQSGAVWLVRFSPDSRQVVSVDVGFTVRVWDATDGHDLVSPRTISPSPGGFYGSGWAIRPDLREVAFGYPDGTIRLWNLADRQAPPRILRGHTGKIVGLAYSSNGNSLASTSAGQGKPSRTFMDDQPGGELMLWDVATGGEVTTLRRHIDVFRWLAFSPDGRQLVLSDGGAWANSGEVHVWDTATGAEVFKLRGHAGNVQQVAFSPDGTRIASAGWDKVVKLWDAATGHELLTFRGHTAGVNCVAFSPDGQRLVSSSIDWTARVWDATPLRTDSP